MLNINYMKEKHWGGLHGFEAFDYNNNAHLTPYLRPVSMDIRETSAWSFMSMIQFKVLNHDKADSLNI